jgi:hypothetical protein
MSEILTVIGVTSALAALSIGFLWLAMGGLEQIEKWINKKLETEEERKRREEAETAWYSLP